MGQIVLGSDEWQVILSNIDDVYDFQNTFLVCKMFMKFYKTTKQGKYIFRKYTNPLWILLDRHKEELPDNVWRSISSHPRITWEIIREYSNFPWEYDRAIINPNIKWELAQENQNVGWKLEHYTFNLNFDKYIIRENPHINFHLGQFSMSNRLTWDMVEYNIDAPWNWDNISEQRFITEEILEKYPNLPWNYQKLSNNRNITREFMLSHPAPWNIEWALFKYNPTLEMVQENLPPPYTDGHLCALSKSHNITINIIESNPKPLGGDWNYYGLSINRNINMDFVLRNLDKDWHWDCLSHNPAITLYDIESNINTPGVQWNWHEIGRRSDMTREFIERHLDTDIKKYTYLQQERILDYKWLLDHPEINIAWNCLSMNPNLTWQDIDNNINEPWDWYCLFRYV